MPGAVWQGAAAAVALAHLAGVLFLLAGGFVARRRRALLPAHLAVMAGVLAVTAAGAPCPLTELELWLLERGGAEPYEGGFVEHYLVAPVYPAGLTPAVTVLVNAVAVASNLVAYRDVLRRGRRRGAGTRAARAR